MSRPKAISGARSEAAQRTLAIGRQKISLLSYDVYHVGLNLARWGGSVDVGRILIAMLHHAPEPPPEVDGQDAEALEVGEQVDQPDVGRRRHVGALRGHVDDLCVLPGLLCLDENVRYGGGGIESWGGL